MDQDVNWYGYRPRPRPHCVIRGPSSPPRKGAQQPSTFRHMSIVVKRSLISATAELLLKISAWNLAETCKMSFWTKLYVRKLLQIKSNTADARYNGLGKMLYTLNHKKRDILFLTITLANLDRFLYHFNREEILHSTVVKLCHITRFMCAPYLEKLNPTFCRYSWNCTLYIWLQLCQIITDFNNFCSDETRKMYKTGHTFTYLLLKESVANDVINVSLFVCCEPRHRRVEASSVGLCRRWRRTFWTVLMIATLKIAMSKWQHCKFD